jgi:DNA-binding NarL/FixJ family response regulator
MSALAQSQWDERAEEARLKVVIADDHPLLLAGIRRALEAHTDLEIVGEARSGPELIGMVERRKPDVVVLDLRMPGVVGTECIERIHATWPEVKSIVLSAQDDRPTIDGALAAGASAYVVKSVNTADIASIIRQTASGSAIYRVQTSAAASGPASAPEPELPALTARERSILTAVAGGMTTAAISRELWVSDHTVKFHLTNIYRKLGVSNRAGAVSYAFAHGLCS